MEANFEDFTRWLEEGYRDRLREIVGSDSIDAVLESFLTTKSTTFRINTIRTAIDEAVAALLAETIDPVAVPWCSNAFLISPDQRESLSHSSLATDGHIYIQGLSSIFATLVLQPVPGQWNLDMAAAPGGKASHIAALMQNQGKLSVVEPIRPRMFRLADNLKRLGVTIQKTYLMDGRKVGKKVPDRFDRILLDAPCSGDSRIRVDKPKSWHYWSLRKVKEQSRKQRGLIVSAFHALKPGGQMVYCTCSFSPEENEAIVDHLLTTEPDAKLVEIETPFSNVQPGMTHWDGAEMDPRVDRCVRILPNENFDAFFIAKIVKSG